MQIIADNLRQARASRNWTQHDLAEQSGVSRRMIAGIESGQSNVSLATLDQLAVALGISFTALITKDGSTEQMTRLQEGQTIWQGVQPESHAELLGSTPVAGRVELWHWALAPGDTYQAEPDPPGMSEMLYVLRGTLELTLRNEPIMLEPGNTFIFPSDQPYAYRNAGKQVLRFIKNVVVPARN